MPKIERTSSLVSTPRVQSVPKPSAPASAAPTGPVTGYAGQAAKPKELVPRGANVSKSASPSSLWGDAPKQANLDQAAFKTLAPPEQKKVVEAAKAEREQLTGEIHQRVEVLDKKWNNSRLSTRTEALREYHDRGGRRMGRRDRQKLDGLVGRSEEAQRKINVLRAKIDALPRTPEAKKQQVELRNELARELRHARDEQSKVVKEATAVIDSEGLKVDRLAVTEQIIDPSAPAEGSGDSLLDKIKRVLNLDQFFSFVLGWVQNVDVSFDQQASKFEDETKDKARERTERTIFEHIKQLAIVQTELRQKEDLTAPGKAPANPASGA